MKMIFETKETPAGVSAAAASSTAAEQDAGYKRLVDAQRADREARLRREMPELDEQPDDDEPNPDDADYPWCERCDGTGYIEDAASQCWECNGVGNFA